jgi:hypothetical protein
VDGWQKTEKVGRWMGGLSASRKGGVGGREEGVAVIQVLPLPSSL